MSSSTILRTGIVGAVIAAICCFTPVLVVLLGAIGLSAWLDYVLLPALAVFVGMTAYGFWHRRRALACCTVSAQTKEEKA